MLGLRPGIWKLLGILHGYRGLGLPGFSGHVDAAFRRMTERCRQCEGRMHGLLCHGPQRASAGDCWRSVMSARMLAMPTCI